jgi:glyoxylase-like metal-dependent hydrolase (beta-lactamase superfamily II)
VVLVACSSTPSSPKAPVEQVGRAQRFQIGNLEAYALEDGHLVVPNDGTLLAVDRPTSETADLLASAGLPRDTIRLDIQCLLVNDGARVILFDTGLGEASKMPNTGRLPQSLALAGVQPSAVTDIFISHGHSDHIGGLVTKAGALAFPSATIHMSAPEWASFQTAASAGEEGKRYVAAMTAKVVTFEPGAQVLPNVKAIATHGHTPGHTSYEIGAQLFYLGDLAHHSIISVQRPAWSIQVDGERPVAEAMRRDTLAKLAADRTRVFATHFPYPGIGHVVADGQGLVWKAD